MHDMKRIITGLACALAIVAAAHAQTPEEKIPAYKLDLRTVPDIPSGQAALVTGEAGSIPDRFYLENLYMLKPVAVTVRAVNPGDSVNVRLTKWKWDDALREGAATTDRQVEFRFRTQGEFQISVTSNKPRTPYKMVVWVGPDITPQSKPLFVPRSEFQDAGAGIPAWMRWAGGAAVIFAALAFVALRRKQAS